MRSSQQGSKQTKQGYYSLLVKQMSNSWGQSQHWSNPLLVVLRWLILLPGAILAALLAQFLTIIGNNVLMYFKFFGPDTFLGKVWIVFIGNVIFGGVLILAGGFIAPTHRRIVAVVLAGVLLVGTGAMALYAILLQQYWDIFAVIAIDLGGVSMAVSIHKGEVLSQTETDTSVHHEEDDIPHTSDPWATSPTRESLMEMAEDAPVSMRILVDVLQSQLEQTHPQVKLLPQWPLFQMVGTVAGCMALAMRLHFDVPEELRTPLEMAMRNSLRQRFEQAERAYGNCHGFVTEKMYEVPRSKRGKYIFTLLGMWILNVVSGGRNSDEEKLIVNQIAATFMSETTGFWKD